MNLQIRQCEITDAKAIHDLNTREMGYDYSEDKTKEKIVEKYYGNCRFRQLSEKGHR